VPLSVFRGQRKPGKKWLQSDVILNRALDLYEDSLCPECGQPRAETFDPLHDGDNPYRTAEYIVGAPLRDHACTALARARKRIDEQEMPHSGALRFGIHLQPMAKPQP
jgi:hypothetical protein